jgi:hypothetical protein
VALTQSRTTNPETRPAIPLWVDSFPPSFSQPIPPTKVITMTRTVLRLSGLAMFLAAALPLLADTVAYDKYLTPADVEKVTGLKGLTQKVAGRELTFSEGTRLVLNVRFQGAKAYRLNRETPDYVQGEVAGVGEAAFSGPAGNLQYVLIFRNKDFCVRLYTYIDKSDPAKTVLTMDQLIALGKIIASRM